MVGSILGLVRFNYKEKDPKWSDDHILDIGNRAVSLFPPSLFEKCELVGTSEYDDNYLSKEKGLPREFLWGHVVDIKYVLRDLKKFDTGEHYRMLGLVEDFLNLDERMVGGYMPDRIGVASLEGGIFYSEVEKNLAQVLTIADELAHSFGLQHPQRVLDRLDDKKSLVPRMVVPIKSLKHENYCLMLFNSIKFCSSCQRKLENLLSSRTMVPQKISTLNQYF